MFSRAFLWNRGTMRDLGTLAGATFSAAVAVNDKGQIAGNSDTGNGLSHAVLWDGGTLRDFGIPSGRSQTLAAAINNRGQVVGTSLTEAGGWPRAFLWDRGVLTEILGDTNSAAYGINDAGQIVGQFEAASGVWHAFLLTPTRCTQQSR